MKNLDLKLAEAMAGITVMTIDGAFKRGELTAKAAFDKMFTEMTEFYAELDQFPADKNAAFGRFLAVLTRMNGWKAVQTMEDEIEAAIAALDALFVGSKNTLFITYFNMAGDGSPGSRFKLRVHVGPGSQDFSFHATSKGWLLAKQVNGDRVRYESEIRSDRRFVDGIELRNLQNDTLEGVAGMDVYLHSTIGEAIRAEVRPHVAIWTDSRVSESAPAAYDFSSIDTELAAFYDIDG